MHPSVPTFVLTLAALAIGGAEGFKFRKRANPVGTSNAQGAQNVLITNAEQNLFYIAMHFGSQDEAGYAYSLVSTTRGDIILPGQHAKNITGFTSQGKSVAEGPVYSGPVSAAGWTVPDQDIIYYQNSDANLLIPFGGEYAYAGFSVWPNTSTIAQAFGDWSADTFIARILAEANAGLYWTLLISPLEEDRGTDQSFGGILTIGEIVDVEQIFNVTDQDLQKANFPDLKLVTEYPCLNNSGVYGGHTYYAIIDAISWVGGSATLNSTVPGTPSGKTSAYIDSTYAWIHAPYHITEELYKNLKNSTYDKDSGLWYFECTELTVNITIAGHAYPLSPLTVAQHFESLTCVGTFQAKPENAGGDIVLGVPFLKNVYARFSYLTRSNNEVYNPYVQLMPVTNVEDAHNDWVIWCNKWGGNHSPSSNPTTTPTLTYTSTHPPSPSSSPANPQGTGGNKVAGAVEDDNKDDLSVSRPVKHALGIVIAVVVGAVLLGLVVIGGLVFCLVKRLRKGRDGKGAYRGLEKPDDGVAPHVPLYGNEGTGGRYGEGGQGRYTDPYED